MLSCVQFHQEAFENNFLLLFICWWWWWWIVFVVWLTDERRLALLSARTIVRDLTIANLRHAASRIWTCAEPEFRLCWMMLSSGDNHYTAASVISNTPLHIFHYITTPLISNVVSSIKILYLLGMLFNIVSIKASWNNDGQLNNIWGNVFKIGPNKFRGKHPLKKLKWLWSM